MIIPIGEMILRQVVFFSNLSKSYRNWSSCIPIGNFKFPLEILFFLREKIFSCGILFCKSWQVRYNENNDGWKLFKQFSIIWHTWNFRYMQLRSVQKCHLCTGRIIRPIVTSIRIWRIWSTFPPRIIRKCQKIT